MVDELEFNQYDLDMLKECINIGIGNAVNALSELLKKKVEIDIPEIKYIKIDDFSKEFGDTKKDYLGVFLPISNDLSGQSILLLDDYSAKKIISKLYDLDSIENINYDEANLSALKETSNIIIGAYLTSISNFLDLSITPKLPDLLNDKLNAIIDFGINDFKPKMNSMFLAKENLFIEDEKIQGTVLLFFTNDSNKKIVSQLHERYKV